MSAQGQGAGGKASSGQGGKAAKPAPQVYHDEVRHRIWVPGPSSPTPSHPPVWPGDEHVEVQEAAVLAYELQVGQGPGGKTVIDLVSTHVPEVHRGRGLAAILVSTAFTHARAQGYVIRPTCSYIAHTWLGKNRGQRDIVLQEGQ